jgi:hypothetical protein
MLCALVLIQNKLNGFEIPEEVKTYQYSLFVSCVVIEIVGQLTEILISVAISLVQVRAMTLDICSQYRVTENS